MKKLIMIIGLLFLSTQLDASLRCTWLETKASVTNDAMLAADQASKETFCKLGNQFMQYAEEYMSECSEKSNLGMQGSTGMMVNNIKIIKEKCGEYTRTVSDDVNEWLDKSTNNTPSSSPGLSSVEYAELQRLRAEKEERKRVEQTRKKIEEQSVYRPKIKLYKVVNVANWDTLNVRTKPYVTKNNKVDELAPYAQNIQVLQRKKNHKGTLWSRIRYTNNNGYNIEGWVVSRCLSLQNSTRSHKTQRQTLYRVVKIPSNDTLSVRASLGTQYQKIGDLPYYARGVQMIKCGYSNKGGKWCQIRYGGIEGWVSAKYLRRQ